MPVNMNRDPYTDTGTGAYTDTLQTEHSNDHGPATGAFSGPSGPETYTSDDPTAVEVRHTVTEPTVHTQAPHAEPATTTKKASKKK